MLFLRAITSLPPEYLDNTQVNDAGGAELQKALPKCVISL